MNTRKVATQTTFGNIELDEGKTTASTKPIYLVIQNDTDYSYFSNERGAFRFARELRGVWDLYKVVLSHTNHNTKYRELLVAALNGDPVGVPELLYGSE